MKGIEMWDEREEWEREGRIGINCACMCIQMETYACLFLYVCVRSRVVLNTLCVLLCPCVYAYVSVYAYTFSFVLLCMRVCVRTCLHVLVCMRVCFHMYAYACMTCLFACVCVCMHGGYVCTFDSSFTHDLINSGYHVYKLSPSKLVN